VCNIILKCRRAYKVKPYYLVCFFFLYVVMTAVILPHYCSLLRIVQYKDMHNANILIGSFQQNNVECLTIYSYNAVVIKNLQPSSWTFNYMEINRAYFFSMHLSVTFPFYFIVFWCKISWNTRCSLCRLIRILSTWCHAAVFFSRQVALLFRRKFLG
jgi:hypothetical protein